jgi:hypothetical protein
MPLLVPPPSPPSRPPRADADDADDDADADADDDDDRLTDDELAPDRPARRARRSRAKLRFTRDLFDLDGQLDEDDMESCQHIYGRESMPALDGGAQDDAATRGGTYEARSPGDAFNFLARCTGGPTLLAATRAFGDLKTVVPLRRDGVQEMELRKDAWADLEPFLRATDMVTSEFVERSKTTRLEGVRLRLHHLVSIDCPYVHDSVMGLVQP